MYAKPFIFRKRRQGSPRAERTAVCVQQAFQALLAAKAFEQISVADLAERSGLARSTVYRRWAGLDDLFWAMVQPGWEEIAVLVFAGESEKAATVLAGLWAIPGHGDAMRCRRLATEIARRAGVTFASEVERVARHRRADAFEKVARGSIGALLDQRSGEAPDIADAKELFELLHAAAVGLPSSGGRTSSQSSSGGFPAAVSLRESLAHEDYILSMIDGRPYPSLKRHLSRFGMTPDIYRRCFGLPDDYPMVAKSFSAQRRLRARAIFSGADQGTGETAYG